MKSIKRQHELILSAAGDCIYGISVDGLATFVNPASVEKTGRLPEDIIGKPIHDMHHHTKPDGSPYPREECSIYAAVSDGLVHQCDDEVFWRKDGSSFPVEYTSMPIYENKKRNSVWHALCLKNLCVARCIFCISVSFLLLFLKCVPQH